MKRLIPLAALCLCLSAPSFAQTNAPVPPTLNFQGRLAKPDGTPVPDTNAQSLTFSLYDALTGGNLLWTQTSANVAVHNGVFAAKLDFSTGFQTGKTFAGTFANPLITPYLQIKVGTNAPLTPRQPFASTPYAFVASSALSVPNGSIGLSQLAGGVLNFTNIAGTITGSQIAPGTITSGSLAASLQQTLNALVYTGGGVPALTGSVGTGNSPSSGAVSGGYAYIVNYNDNTLQVFNVSNPAAPALTGSVAAGGGPQNVAVSGSYAYVVNANGNTLQVFNVSNPAAPAFAGSVSTGNSPEGVAVSGGYVYVVSLFSNTLQVFDVSNPAAPTLTGSVGTGGGPQNVAVSGGYAYVVNIHDNTLQVFSVSNPAAPTLKSTIGTGNRPQNIAVSGSYAYVVNANGNTLQVFNVSNPAALTLTGSVSTGNSPSSVAVSGGYAYIVNSADGTLQVFSVSNPAAPTPTAAVSTGILPETVAVVGSYAYVLNVISNTLQVFAVNALTVNARLQLTGGVVFADGTTQATAGLVPGSAAGGDLAGTYPNPAIAANAVTSGKLASDTASLAKISSGILTVPAASTLAVAANTTITGLAASPALTVIGSNNFPQMAVVASSAAPFGAFLSLDATQTANGKNWLLYSTGGTAGEGAGKFVLRNLTYGAIPLAVLPTGQVGINTSNPNAAYALDVNGVAHAASFSTASDARFKTNVRALDNAPEDVLNLRGVSYDMDREKWAGKRNFPEGRQIGFIAQEVEKIFPELVLTDSEGYKSVLYQNAVPILVEAIKAQEKRIKALEDANAELKKQNAAIAELAREIAELKKEKRP